MVVSVQESTKQENAKKQAIEFEKEQEEYRKLESARLQAEINKKKKADELRQQIETDKFVDNHDGTVTHKKSGLIWKRCLIGQKWVNNICEGDAKKFSWYDATQLTPKLLDKHTWRLPTKEELVTLIYCSDGEYNADGGCRYKSSVISPTISVIHFPNTPRDWFWSSTKDDENDIGWYVNFSNGELDWHLGFGYYIRLVRNGK